jgi:hypothetical protein
MSEHRRSTSCRFIAWLNNRTVRISSLSIFSPGLLLSGRKLRVQPVMGKPRNAMEWLRAMTVGLRAAAVCPAAAAVALRRE